MSNDEPQPQTTADPTREATNVVEIAAWIRRNLFDPETPEAAVQNVAVMIAKTDAEHYADILKLTEHLS